MIFFYLIKESLVFAINSLIINKLRTLLSLLGITIGIFAIITVFTVIDALENSIRDSISKLGSNTVYIQKWPWQMGGEYKWWKFLNRPVPKLSESSEIMRRSSLASATTFIIAPQATVQYKDNYADNIQLFCAEHSYEDIRSFDISNGRYFSLFESLHGKNKAIIGSELANQLFNEENPIGKTIKIKGSKLTVIGVFKKEGSDLFGMNMDKNVLIPINFAKNVVDIKNEYLGPQIWVKAKDGVTADELKDELTGIMRSMRRLKPSEDDNFALNQTSLISQGFDGLFKVVDFAGIFIGGFAIIIGVFGIANIMFVSVKEQTKLIGIQKAIGAKSKFILLQFLFESVILALIGGIIGLLLIYLLTLITSAAFDMDFSMTIKNVSVGLILSIVSGIISGILPAYQAAKLNPVEAIATN
jgi:putative ABC transport system permease protein